MPFEDFGVDDRLFLRQTERCGASPFFVFLKLHTNRFVNQNVLMGVAQEAGFGVAEKDLDFSAVATRAKEVAAIWRDVEMAGMDAGRLVTNGHEFSRVLIDCKNGDSIVFQAVAGIEEFPVGTEVDVACSTGFCRVGNDRLQLLQTTVAIAENAYFSRHFANQIARRRG